MDAGISSFGGSSAVTPLPPVAEPYPRAAPEPFAPVTPPAAAPASSSSELQVNLDPATHSLVYKMVDVASGDVVQQTPDEGRLKLRAYIDGVVANRQQPLVERVA